MIDPPLLTAVASFACHLSIGFSLLDRQLGISPPEPNTINEHADIGANHRYIAREASYGAEKVAE